MERPPLQQVGWFVMSRFSLDALPPEQAKLREHANLSLELVLATVDAGDYLPGVPTIDMGLQYAWLPEWPEVATPVNELLTLIHARGLSVGSLALLREKMRQDYLTIFDQYTPTGKPETINHYRQAYVAIPPGTPSRTFWIPPHFTPVPPAEETSDL